MSHEKDAEAPSHGGKRTKKGGNKRLGTNAKKDRNDSEEKENSEDAGGDSLFCQACQTYFKTPKLLQQHYKKQPEHHPDAIKEAARLEREQEKVKDEKPAKVKKKMHGHRGFWSAFPDTAVIVSSGVFDRLVMIFQHSFSNKRD